MIHDLERARQDCLFTLEELLTKGIINEREKQMIYLRFFSQEDLLSCKAIGENLSLMKKQYKIV